MGTSDIAQSGPGTVIVGRHCSIGAGVSVTFSQPGKLVLGDYVSLGDGVRIVVSGGDVWIGDWTTLHSNCLVMSSKGVSIGQHCWFGQNCVIDGTGGLTIGNGVRVGMFSQLWTHVAAGEQIEGCTLYGATPSTIEDDVWLVGTCTMGSGVKIGRRTVALAGSNITKSTPEGSTVAGAPAKVREGVSFYREVSLDEKFSLLEGWLREFAAETGAGINAAPGQISVVSDGGEVVFIKAAADYDAALDLAYIGQHPLPDKTLCCVENKRYVKIFTPAERAVLKFLEGNKARFYD